MKQQPDISKYDFKTLYQLLMITANDIAYPPEVPPNTPDKTPPEGLKKYGIFDLRKYTDNQGWLPVKINYQNFKPKKYYKDVNQIQLENHLQALQRKQQLLKQFKHHQDFDRIDYLESRQSNTYENHIEKMFTAHFIFSLAISRIATIQMYAHKFAFTLWRNVFRKTYFSTFPIVLIISITYQSVSPINHEYFRSNLNSVRMYQSFAYNADAYQFNNDIKYNFKYPQKKDFEDVAEHVQKMRMVHVYEDSLRYYKKLYGLVEAEPYEKKGKKNQTKQKA